MTRKISCLFYLKTFTLNHQQMNIKSFPMHMAWDLESVFGLVVVHSYLWLTSNPDFRLECSLDRHPGNAHNLTRVRGHGTWLTRDHVSRFSPFGRWTLLHYLYFCFSEETKHGIDYWLFHKGLISFIIGGKLRVWSGPKEKLFSHLVTN